MICRALLWLGASLMLMSVDLPESGPRPDVKPAAESASPEAPKPPEPRPAAGAGAGAVETPAAGEIPIPEEKPETGRQTPAGEKPAEPPAPAPPAAPDPIPVTKEDPQELAACLADLTAIGARFEEHPTLDSDENGCGIDRPVVLTEVLPGIPLSDIGPMRCQTALTLARWMKETVNPTLKIALPERRITGLSNAASYVCRLRNHAETGKISEHARGNAVDIGAFTLDNGDTITMTPKQEDATLTGAFQRTVTAGACLYFTTVLSPGSDATHQDHLHLDVMARTGGYRYCR